MDIESKDFSPQSRLLGRIVEYRRATARYILFAFAIALILHIAGLTALLTSKRFQEKFVFQSVTMYYTTVFKISPLRSIFCMTFVKKNHDNLPFFTLMINL